MPTPQAPAGKARDSWSSALLLPVPERTDDGLRGLSRRWPVHSLATPPVGSELKAVPGDAGLPFVGHVLDYIRFGSELGRERYERLGPVSWMGAIGTKMVVIAGPTATQQALTSKGKAFSQDGWNFLIDRFFHRGLMLMSFDEHRRHRRIMQEAFTRHLPTARAGHSDDLFAALCDARAEDGQQFSDDDVITHMIFLMMAAHDTWTITTTAVAYYLAKHPDWQDKVRAESDALGDRAPAIDDLEGLAALHLVIKESLRLVAPVPLVMRKTVEDTEIEGYYIPADTLVAITPAVNHFDRDIWNEPDRFDTSRFDDPRREDQEHRFAWLPFGGGAHKCIGMHFGTLEVKAILHEMLRTYSWDVAPDYRVRWDNTSLPIPVDGLPVRLHRR